MAGKLERDLESQLQMVHDRFVTAMNRRLPTMTIEEKERYLAVLAPLVARLEEDEKPLREILQETVRDAAPHVLREIGGGA